MVASDELLTRFARVLPGWFGRCGLRDTKIADAVQEALVAVLVKIRAGQLTFPMDEARATQELVRVVSVVARRVRRHARREVERSARLDRVDVLDDRDDAAAVDARLLLLEAIERLDEDMRAMIVAHEIEGRTNVEIAGIMKLKEDAVEYRVGAARSRLRSEVEHLEGDKKRRPKLAVFVPWNLGFGDFDILDRALIGAAYEATGVKALLMPQRRGRTPSRPNLPTAALVGALVLVPASSPAVQPVAPPVKHFSFSSIEAVLASDDDVTQRPTPNAFIAQNHPFVPLAPVARLTNVGSMSSVPVFRGLAGVLSSASPKVVPTKPLQGPTPRRPDGDQSDPPTAK